MNIVGKLLSNFKGLYNEINSATLTGAIDVVIVEQEDGSFISSPFHVRFGKLGVLRAREKLVDIEVNGNPVDLHMKLGEAGEAFFVHGAGLETEIPPHLATSPLPDCAELLMQEGLEKMRNGMFPDVPCSSITTPDDLWPAGVSTESAMPRDVSEQTLYYSSENLAAIVNASVSDNHQMAAVIEAVDKEKAFESASTELESTNDASADCTELPPGGSDDMSTSPLSPPRLTAQAPSSGECVQPVADGKFAGKLGSKMKKRKKKKNGKGSQEVQRSNSSSDSSHCGGEEGVFELELHPDDDSVPHPPVSGLSAFSPVATATTPGEAGPISAEQRLSMTDEWASSQFASDFHPFSDGDITPVVSPVGSRPPSPKSDTEFERHKSEGGVPSSEGAMKTDDVKWKWGELPESSVTTLTESDTAGKTADKSPDEKASGGLFQFMRKTKKIRHQPQQQGIYLDDLDLNDMDPEVTALYLYNPNKGQQSTFGDEDNESGRGASLPHSPINVEVKEASSILRPQPQLSFPSIANVALSLCGGLKECSAELASEKFLQYLITWEELCERPALISDPRLIIRIAGKYYNWQVAGPMILSVLAFRRPLPDIVVESLCKLHMPKKERRRGWFSWGRSPPPSDTTPDATTSSPPPVGEVVEATGDDAVKSDVDTVEVKVEETDPSSVTISISDDKSLDINSIKEDAAAHDEVADMTGVMEKDVADDLIVEKFCKSLKLTTEEIESLGLQPGSNEVTFSVTTQYQGTTRCTSHIYLWRWDDRVIVSDIDGTITRSDVLGHVLPMIGKDWSQAGIANLYTMVARNGYKFLYLSARAIGQSRITRDYLRSVQQAGNVSLPDGPLLLSPSSLMSAFHREVIERKPEEFKIGCLRDISALFPQQRNPFYAGFGNKINDVWAYRAVGIPLSRVFTVNHKGELRMEMSAFQSSYDKLSDVVDHFFPPLLDRGSSNADGRVASGNFQASEQFSSFTYWRNPLPTISQEEMDQLQVPDVADKK